MYIHTYIHMHELSGCDLSRGENVLLFCIIRPAQASLTLMACEQKSEESVEVSSDTAGGRPHSERQEASAANARPAPGMSKSAVWRRQRIVTRW